MTSSPTPRRLAGLPLAASAAVSTGATPATAGSRCPSAASTVSPAPASCRPRRARSAASRRSRCARRDLGSGEVAGDALKTPVLAIAIAISGSGKVRLKQLATDELSAKVSGSGELEFAGRTGRLGVSIAGHGSVRKR